jgi:hypothetical protein
MEKYLLFQYVLIPVVIGGGGTTSENLFGEFLHDAVSCGQDYFSNN